MKAISILQPWASLIAQGQKTIETRSWKTSYRGPLAIHVAKKIDVDICHKDLFLRVLNEHGIYLTNDLPLGAVIAIGNLVDCVKVKETDGLMAWLEHGHVADDYEFPFGDFTPGRFGWILKDVQKLPEPIPAKGRLGLWEWEPPKDVITYEAER